MDANPMPVSASDAICKGVYLLISFEITLHPLYLGLFQKDCSNTASSNSAVYNLSARLLEGCV
jgi:hypothetical protein